MVIVLKELSDYCLAWSKLDISPTDLVLDVGSGHKPLARANILCDKFFCDDTERRGTLLVDRPVVVGDALFLPFKDRSIGYVYTSHMIEHIPDPERCLRELSRVARKGCVNAPSKAWEKMAGGVPSHLWFVRVDTGKLVLEEKEEPIVDTVLKELALRMYARDSYKPFYWRHRDLLEVAYEWKEEINYEIVRRSGERQGSNWIKSQELECSATSEPVRRESIRQAVASLLGLGVRMLRSRAALPRLVEILACPFCLGHMEEVGAEAIACLKCKRKYPVRRGTPFMLRELATSGRNYTIMPENGRSAKTELMESA
ncbi:MAG: methyltransferase domain-containing protein [Chloroflexi bacterium]|nr:methyltransferase domain-containing protein [Chloroflexota bacterium]